MDHKTLSLAEVQFDSATVLPMSQNTSGGEDTSVGSVSPARSSSIESGLEHSTFADAEQKLMKMCLIPSYDYKRRVFKVLEKLRSKSVSSDDLISKFADKCYEGQVKDPVSQSKAFIKLAFRSPKALFTFGPNDAFHYNVCQLAAQMNNDIEKTTDLPRSRGSTVSDRYRVKSKLGSGGTANVHLAVDMKTEKYVALKVYNKKRISVGKNEAAVLEVLNGHRNIIGFKKLMDNICWDEKNESTSVIALEYAEMGALIEYVVAVKRFSRPMARWIFTQVLSALDFCHENNVAHRDIKPDNCLMCLDENDEWVVKLGDFGTSKKLKPGEKMTSMFGTERYAAPELLKQQPYDKQVDVFSLGVLLYVLISGVHPFVRAERRDHRYARCISGKWERFWKESPCKFTNVERDLIQGMLEYRPERRLTMREVTYHPWIVDYDVISNGKASVYLNKCKAGMKRCG